MVRRIKHSPSLAPTPPSSGPSIWVVVTCMGRLTFLRETAPRLIAQPDLNYCLVDYSCPERCGEWFESRFADAVRQRRALVTRASGKSFFEKSKALNIGGRAAIARGADYLCFLDGDTIARPGFGGWLRAHVRPDRFIVTASLPQGGDVHSLMGLLVMPTRVFLATGGYDEGMFGYGGEDIEMRLRLGVKERLTDDRIPLRFVDCIEHGDELRDNNHVLGQTESNLRNLQRAFDAVRRWTGRDVYELDARIQRLLWWPPGKGPAAGDPAPTRPPRPTNPTPVNQVFHAHAPRATRHALRSDRRSLSARTRFRSA